ncbi:hypothetical protein [Clostridium yunnanense]|nr:hypothetical protein [Clostridium yunnanense]
MPILIYIYESIGKGAKLEHFNYNIFSQFIRQGMTGKILNPRSKYINNQLKQSFKETLEIDIKN